MTYRPLLCLDFDGVIHGYHSGWQGAAIIRDPPVPGIGLYLLNVLPHCRVAVFSSRSRSLRGRRAMRRYVRDLLRDAVMQYPMRASTAWSMLADKPVESEPWTVYDKRDQADEIFAYIEWPWFKPPAVVTIDDRALTFNGDWDDPAYSPDRLYAFQPWNKKPRRVA